MGIDLFAWQNRMSLHDNLHWGSYYNLRLGMKYTDTSQPDYLKGFIDAFNKSVRSSAAKFYASFLGVSNTAFTLNVPMVATPSATPESSEFVRNFRSSMKLRFRSVFDNPVLIDLYEGKSSKPMTPSV